MNLPPPTLWRGRGLRSRQESPHPPLQGYPAHKKHLLLGLYSRHMPMVLQRSQEGGGVLMSEVRL